jgi:hypothetical protein
MFAKPLAGIAAGALAVGLALASPAHATSAPFNDNLASAQFLPGPTNTVSGFNTGATTETGEPLHLAGHGPFHSVWYRWIAPARGNAIFRTQGSNFDTVLAAYQTGPRGDLVQLASDDDTTFEDGTIRQSLISFRTVQGAIYFIAVDGFSDLNVGSIKLSWTSNDDFAEAQPISGPAAGGFTVAGGSTVGATREAGEPHHANLGTAGSVWFTWQAPATARTEIATLANNFDTLLGVYAGTSLTALTEVGSDNDSGATPHSSQVTFTATAGTVYRIAVDGPKAVVDSGVITQGTFVLRVQQFGPAISVGDASSTEGASGTKNLAVPVTFSEASPSAVSVNFATSSGTATADGDFTARTGTLVIPAGSKSGSILIPILGDKVKESSEQFTVTISKAVGGSARIVDPVASATIVNDD